MTPADLPLFERRKVRVAEIRRNVEARLSDGDRGLQVATTLGRQFGEFVAQVAGEELDATWTSDVAIIGVGGTGRGVMAPHSDVDLMLLVAPDRLEAFEAAVAPFVQALWDAKLRLGHSVRTVKQAVGLAVEDDKTATSYLATQLLWGSEDLRAQFASRFRSTVVERNRPRFVERCVRARKSEFTDEHPAIQMLEPNVKTSLGALRDLHLLMWVAEASYSTSDFVTLQLYWNRLSQADASRLQAAYEFLLRLRTRLHLWADAPQDQLSRAAQLAIAEAEGIEATESQRAVELLMQDYFLHTGEVATIVERFVNRHRPRPMWKAVREKFRERRVDGRLIVGPLRVDTHQSNHGPLTDSVEAILRVYEVAAENGVLPSPTLSEAIRIGCIRLQLEREGVDGEELELSTDSCDRFKAILGDCSSVANVLRHMSATGALDLVLPEWQHVRGLLQFNQYHHFTVDEHTLRAVAEMAKLTEDPLPAGTAYRNLASKGLAHLSAVLHDIGKGHDEDHCIVGQYIARVVGPRLRYSPNECDQLAALVRWHLEMADLALRRDTTDPKLLAEFAHKVGTSETLTMLYVLTVCDIHAVGPGTWTRWKGELLADLYARTNVILSGKPYGGFEAELIEQTIERTTRLLPRESVSRAASDRSELQSETAEEWAAYVRRQLQSFSAYYLTTTPPEQIAEDLATLRRLEVGDLVVKAEHDRETRSFTFRVLLHETTSPNCFHSICGTLTARSLPIVEAEINTTSDGYVVDGFRTLAVAANDVDRLLAEVSEQIRDVILNEEEVTTIFQRHERYGVEAEDTELPSGLGNRVEIDTTSSETRLVVDIFTQNKRGLLYTVAKAIQELDLNIELAKIGTHFDQVIDVFYVTERDGSKPCDPERIESIQKQLLSTLDAFQQDGFKSFRRSSTNLFRST